MTTIRIATAKDLPVLTRQAETISQTTITWENRLGTGESRENYLTMVVEDDAEVIGHLCAGPSFRTSSLIGPLGIPRSTEQELHWWKIHSVAVEPRHQGQGHGTSLLEALRERTPRGVPGLYGSISRSHTPTVHRWYMAKGFRVAVNIALKDGFGPGTGLVPVRGSAENVFFHATLDRLSYHAANPPTAEQDHRYAIKELEADAKHLLSADYAYRALAQTLSARVIQKCDHLAEFSAQQQHLIAWDPDNVLSCTGCFEARLDAVHTSDDQYLCDGCNNRDQSVELGRGIDDLTVADAGLCLTCRRQAEFPRFA